MRSMPQLSAPFVEDAPSGSRSHANELHASEAGIDTVLFDQMEESVVIFQRDATYLYVNPATERMFGKPRQELLGRVFWDVFPGSDRGDFHRAFLRAVETGKVQQFEHLYEPWGRWYRQRLYLSGDRVYVFSQETTEERLRADTVQLHGRILESMTEGVCLADEHGVIIYTNPAQERMFGYASGELVGQHVSILNAYPPEENLRLVNEVSARLRAERNWEGEFQNRRKDGTPFITEVRISTLHIGGKPRWLAVQKDVTEQRHAERERAETYRFTEQLYEQTRLAEQRATFLALASEVLASSLDREEILRSLTHLSVPTLGDWCAVDEATPDGKVRRISMVNLRPERIAQAEAFHAKYPITLDDSSVIGKVLCTGTTDFTFELPDELIERVLAADPERLRATRELGIKSLICVPLNSRGRTLAALTLVYTDSDRRYTEADVRLAEDLARRAAMALDNGLLYKEAQDAIRARDSFLSIASHELNTPLTSLGLNVQALQRALQRTGSGSSDSSQDIVGAKLQSMQRQISRLAKLIHELLDVSRISAGKLRLEPEELDLATLVRELVPRFVEDLTRAGCELRLEIPEAPVLGYWDLLRMEQILQNLLSNAIKYGRGAPIHLQVQADAQWARVVVRDQGIGIPLEDQRRLFQRFERLASERHYSGFGLGLWIVRQILDAMGGRILLESEPGRGSVFTVELPRRPPESPHSTS
jgi:PAS domain S-box-containing protein